MSVVPIVPESSEGGNTKLPLTKVNKSKQISPSKRWCFTFNNYTESEYEDTIKVCSSNSSKYIVGKEVGESGTPHLQGYIEFEKKIRPKSLFNNKIHWEASKGSREDNLKYCSKDNNYICIGLRITIPIRCLKIVQFYPWQLELYNLAITVPDDRSIFWIWDESGNKGKSAFAKYMCINHDALCVDGKANDIFNGIANFKEDKGYYPEIVIVDCPRHNIGYMNYGAIEKVKNGLVFSGKYESKQMIFNSPHVIIFANSEPEIEKYSADRWIIKKIE